MVLCNGLILISGRREKEQNKYDSTRKNRHLDSLNLLILLVIEREP
uniref:Uncharacterized protein n=1 Tax=Siphoviridae sp. ct5tj9 TaxID=2823564 RepID=A0A8S5LGR9_9CAUD|nr:MAG TPA: hypothetical protein [Siphoviridae sp. ct5tj9]